MSADVGMGGGRRLKVQVVALGDGGFVDLREHGRHPLERRRRRGQEANFGASLLESSVVSRAGLPWDAAFASNIKHTVADAAMAHRLQRVACNQRTAPMTMHSLAHNLPLNLVRNARRCGLLLTLLLAACDKPDAESDADVVAGEGDLIVSGTVVREMTASSLNTPFEPTADAHVRITARIYIGHDAPAEVAVEADVPFAADVPFTYELRGNIDPALLEDAMLLINVQVANHAGNTLEVGDLKDQIFNAVDLGQVDVVVQVEGVESCDDPAADGLCGNP